MKEITIKIKPKLRWEYTGSYYGYGKSNVKWVYCIYVNNDSEKIRHELYSDFKKIGDFKSLKNAKAVAELIYGG